MKKICIITTRHVSYNPRVLKEADAFFARGYAVSVVTINNHTHQHQFDNELMKERLWELKTVNFRKDDSREKLNWIYLSLKQKFYSYLAKFTFRFGIAERTMCKGFDELLQLALAEKADFYLVHHPEALGIGYAASKRYKAKFGFDAEDFHTGMDELKNSSREEEMLSYIEKMYLPHCSYLTAASKGIGECYVNKYKIKPGAVILNVFPKEASAQPVAHIPVRFYWYSQAIGPNRSLEILLQAAATIKAPFEIHLRGSFHNGEYKKVLFDLVSGLDLNNKVFFHAPILARDIIKDAVQYDVGLALESDISINRNICVTNKIFSYLMSGLAIIGTDTYGQKDIFSHFNGAVCLCKKNDVTDLARAMFFYIHQHDKLMQAKAAAKIAAEERFNWECEREKLIDNFEISLAIKGKSYMLTTNPR